MKVIGVIAEYNPLHNGHLYHLSQIKEMYPDLLVVLVVNGYFTQRGDISVLSKEDKTRLSLDAGVDIVLELPFVYGTQASDIFGYVSVKILNELNVDSIVFGSESNNIELLNKVVDIQLNDQMYEENVKKYLLDNPEVLAEVEKKVRANMEQAFENSLNEEISTEDEAKDSANEFEEVDE